MASDIRDSIWVQVKVQSSKFLLRYSNRGPELVIVDEIELGLHERAQKILIDELKKVCLELKCQIICSSHSHTVLSAVPPEARYFIENTIKETIVYESISPDFACGKMGRPNAEELDIFVEDSLAASFIAQSLPASLRKRVQVVVIGSHQAVVRQLKSRYKENRGACICLLDGDQKKGKSSAAAKLSEYAECSTAGEKSLAQDWALQRIFYLPGDTWPEKWILDSIIIYLELGILTGGDQLVAHLGLSKSEELLSLLKESSKADKHSEFFELGELIRHSPSGMPFDVRVA